MKRHARGVTLVELMVSISIGLVVAGAMVALYIGTARSYRQIEALGQLQSNARYVFEIMGYDIRMAGNTGCHVPRGGTATPPPANFVNDYANPNYWWSNTDQPLRGFDETADSNAVGDAGFPRIAPGNYGPNALRGDSIIVLRANTEDNTGSVTNYNLGAGDIPFDDPSGKGFKAGALLLLTDCTNQAAVFQKTGGTDTGPIQHRKSSNGSASNPGNCEDTLAGSCASAGSLVSMTGAKLLPLSASAYYLRSSPYKYPNSNQNIPTLYRQTLGTKSGQVDTQPEELVSGVTDLQIRYGVDTSATPDGVVDAYMTAAAFNAAGYSWDWTDNPTQRRVLAVRVTITLESADNSVASESTSFTLGNGNVITDRRLRRSYTMTFGIRQRLS